MIFDVPFETIDKDFLALKRLVDFNEEKIYQEPLTEFNDDRHLQNNRLLLWQYEFPSENIMNITIKTVKPTLKCGSETCYKLSVERKKYCRPMFQSTLY